MKNKLNLLDIELIKKSDELLTRISEINLDFNNEEITSEDWQDVVHAIIIDAMQYGYKQAQNQETRNHSEV